jgi:hypothetical protein
MATFSLPNGWSLKQHHDYDGDFYTVFSPRQKYSGSLNCAIDYGFIMADDSEIEIPPAVMRALQCHVRAIEARPVALRDVPLGEFILRSPLAKNVYTRGVYDKGAKKYACADESDCSREILLDGDAIVYVDFSY